MGKDFFDEDLLKPDTPVVEEDENQNGVPVRAITQASLGRMARQKKEITTQVAGTAKELEELRMKQQELEKERSELEELSRKQSEYESNKREMMDKLARGIRLLEKEEAQATRMAELLSVMRSRFRESLDELRALDEATWSDTDYEVELNKALVLVEDAKDIYRKALAKIDAENWVKDAAHPVATKKLQGEITRELVARPGFFYWLMVGLAVCIPFALVAAILLVAFLFLEGALPWGA